MHRHQTTEPRRRRPQDGEATGQPQQRQHQQHTQKRGEEAVLLQHSHQTTPHTSPLKTTTSASVPTDDAAAAAAAADASSHTAAGGPAALVEEKTQEAMKPPPPQQQQQQQQLSIHDETNLLFLRKLENKAASLYEASHFAPALELWEEAVRVREDLYGAFAVELVDAVEQLALKYNAVAMSALYEGGRQRQEYALVVLRKAQRLVADFPELLGVLVQSLNNLACCYRRMKKPRSALNLLRESLSVMAASTANLATVARAASAAAHDAAAGKTLSLARTTSDLADANLDRRAVTHLNMCAILSQLGEHGEARDHAKAAVVLCQRELLSDTMRDKLHAAPDGARGATAALKERVVILGIAYHNLGVEEEFVRNFDACLHWYHKAVELCSEQLGSREAITLQFKESLKDAQRKIKAMMRARSSRRGHLLFQEDHDIAAGMRSHARSSSHAFVSRTRRRPQTASSSRHMRSTTPVSMTRLASSPLRHGRRRRPSVPQRAREAWIS